MPIEADAHRESVALQTINCLPFGGRIAKGA